MDVTDHKLLLSSVQSLSRVRLFAIYCTTVTSLTREHHAHKTHIYPSLKILKRVICRAQNPIGCPLGFTIAIGLLRVGPAQRIQIWQKFIWGNLLSKLWYTSKPFSSILSNWRPDIIRTLHILLLTCHEILINSVIAWASFSIKKKLFLGFQLTFHF